MEPADRKDYISAQEQNRESVLIRRFFADRGSHLTHWFWPALRWSLPVVWLGLRIPHERLLRGYARPPKKFLGDVDVLGASLRASSQDEYRSYVTRVRELAPEAHPTQVEWFATLDMIAERKARWPPDLSYIAAAEVKAAYYNAAGDLKAAGDKYNGRAQAAELCKMGFDRVALARFVVTEPVDPQNHHPWMVASSRSSRAMDDYLDETKGISVTKDDPFGTVLISSGAVLGKLEHMAGSTGGEWLREPPENPHRAQAAELRQAVEANLLEVMSRHPFPRTFPVLILACSDDRCGLLYVSGADPAAVCPDCRKPPR
ncbi:MAG TPA: hypothetical protein VN282_05725 [Pyrinomonadaceae bacterium]|nr:hypothetical protein [Pyrinomonadaceae bacterium]